MRRNDGFTLIEMTVALAMLGFISVLVFESLRFGQRSYESVTHRAAASWQVFATQRLIRHLIETSYPLETPSSAPPSEHGLQGEGKHISLIAAAPLAVGGAGLYRYEITLRPDDVGSSDLVIRWRAQSADPSMAAGAEETLLERVSAVEWGYHSGSDWESVWRESALPELVRLRVSFAQGDRRQWSELIVAPRITNDANCRFDVVARRCRSGAL